MIVKVVLEESDRISLFKSLINAASQILSDGIFSFSEEGIVLRSMDTPRVAMVDLTLRPEFFTEYEVKEPTSIKLNLQEFKKVLGRGQKDDILTLQVRENDFQVLYKGSIAKQFTLPLKEFSDDEILRGGNFAFAVMAQFSIGILKEIIQDMEVAGEDVTVVAEDAKLVFKHESSRGKSSAMVEMEPSDEGPLRSLTVSDESVHQATYRTEYLKKFAALDSSSVSGNTTILEFQSNHPLRLSFDIIDSLSISFILAPQITDEDF